MANFDKWNNKFNEPFVNIIPPVCQKCKRTFHTFSNNKHNQKQTSYVLWDPLCYICLEKESCILDSCPDRLAGSCIANKERFGWDFVLSLCFYKLDNEFVVASLVTLQIVLFLSKHAVIEAKFPNGPTLSVRKRISQILKTPSLPFAKDHTKLLMCCSSLTRTKENCTEESEADADTDLDEYEYPDVCFDEWEAGRITSSDFGCPVKHVIYHSKKRKRCSQTSILYHFHPSKVSCDSQSNYSNNKFLNSVERLQHCIWRKKQLIYWHRFLSQPCFIIHPGGSWHQISAIVRSDRIFSFPQQPNKISWHWDWLCPVQEQALFNNSWIHLVFSQPRRPLVNHQPNFVATMLCGHLFVRASHVLLYGTVMLYHRPVGFTSDNLSQAIRTFLTASSNNDLLTLTSPSLFINSNYEIYRQQHAIAVPTNHGG